MSYRHLLLASVAFGVALSDQAIAQDLPAPSDAAGASEDTIIVTARRREESVQEVPLVVNAVGAEDIEKLNLRDGTDVQSLVPGLQLRNEANGIGASGQLRGVQYDINASAGPTVAFYLNDAPIDAGSVLQAMYDIGQVEVLRGPQGTLRGTATPSGSITFTTRKPDLYQAGGTMIGTLTDTGLHNLNGAINVPMIEGILGVRVAGLTQRSNANRVRSIDDDADLDKPYADTDSIRAIATLQPTDWLKLEGMYQVIDREARFYDQYASYSLANPSAPESAVLIRPKDRRSIQETARTVEQKFEVYNWRAEVRYAGQALIYQGSRSNLRFHSIGNQDFANFLQGQDIFQDTNTRSKLTSHEIRLQSEVRVFGMFDYVLGYYRTRQNAPTALTTQTPVLLPPFLGGSVVAIAETPIGTTGITRETAFFGNITAHIGDRTQVSVGLRQIDLESPARFLTIGANDIPTGPAVNDEKLIYTASIQHNFTPDLMVYASTGTSRRAGPSIVNPSLTVLSPLLQSFITLPSEDSESYEVGIKSSWLNNRLIFNLTGFYQKFDNYPYKISTPIYYQGFTFNGTSLVPTVANSAQFGAAVPVKVKGIEAEVDFKVTPNFRIGAIAAYSDGKIKNGLIPCDDLNGDGVPDLTSAAPTLDQLQAAYGGDFIGACNVTQRSSLQSPFNATIQAEYNFPLSGSVDAFARGLANYYGSSKVEPTNAFDDLGSYGLLNLYAGLRDPDGAWELNFYAKNVFDTVKVTRFDPPASTSYQELAPPTFQSTVGKSFTSTYSIIQITPPREFGISLRLSFGSR
ncbi:MAG: TonB-dependent receptor [Novosphingobium sp.]|nr:TonB-dependent receptor [Novosphingobium sp.]MCP5400868.1 TonB-dependent receptor [Novosphingobium sp.]